MWCDRVAVARCLGITIGVNYRPAALSLSAPPVRPQPQSLPVRLPRHTATPCSEHSLVNILITVSPSMNPSAVAAAVARHQVSRNIFYFCTKLQFCLHARQKLFDNKIYKKSADWTRFSHVNCTGTTFVFNSCPLSPYHKVVQ